MQDFVDARLEVRRRVLEYDRQRLEERLKRLRNDRRILTAEDRLIRVEREIERVKARIARREWSRERARKVRLLQDAGLSQRTISAIERYGIYDPAALAAMSDETLLSMRNFGVKALREVRTVVEPYSGVAQW